MREILQKYWYVALGGLILLLFLSKRSGNQTPILQQVGGSDQTTLALASMANDSQNKQLDRQFGFASAFLNYNLQSRQVDQIIPLAQIQANGQLEALRSQTALAQLSAALQQNQINSQTDTQNRAIKVAVDNQRRSDWLGLISTGLSFAGGFI